MRSEEKREGLMMSSQMMDWHGHKTIGAGIDTEMTDYLGKVFAWQFIHEWGEGGSVGLVVQLGDRSQFQHYGGHQDNNVSIQ